MSGNHEHFAALIDESVLGTLSAADEQALDAHLATCQECRTVLREVSAVSVALAGGLPVETPAPALRARVLAHAIGAPVESRTRTVDGEPARGFRVAPWLAAAATVVAIVTSAVAWQYREEAARTRAARQADAVQLQSLEAQLATLRADALTAAQTRAVLGARDLARVELAGQAAAPAAVGRVFWSPTDGLVFAATNLPALPPGSVYQLWVVADAPISAGIGAPTSGGRMSVVASPTVPARPTAFALTIEPEGGRPAPTGAMYLLGPY